MLRTELKQLNKLQASLAPHMDCMDLEKRKHFTLQLIALREKSMTMLKALNPRIRRLSDALNPRIGLGISISKELSPEKISGVKRTNSLPLSDRNAVSTKSQRTPSQRTASLRKIGQAVGAAASKVITKVKSIPRGTADTGKKSSRGESKEAATSPMRLRPRKTPELVKKGTPEVSLKRTKKGKNKKTGSRTSLTSLGSKKGNPSKIRKRWFSRRGLKRP